MRRQAQALSHLQVCCLQLTCLLHDADTSVTAYQACFHTGSGLVVAQVLARHAHRHACCICLPQACALISFTVDAGALHESRLARNTHAWSTIHCECLHAVLWSSRLPARLHSKHDCVGSHCCIMCRSNNGTLITSDAERAQKCPKAPSLEEACEPCSFCDDPAQNENCNNHGKCQKNKCECDGSWKGRTCNVDASACPSGVRDKNRAQLHLIACLLAC